MPGTNRVEHLIVLMLENRSFDNLLGFLDGPGAQGGLTGNESNPEDPAKADSPQVKVSQNAPYVAAIEPPHDLNCVNMQLFGSTSPPADPIAGAVKNGFVQAAWRETGDCEDAKTVMQCFNPDHLPVLSALAGRYRLCIAWHASVPGPTWPNRYFAHAATSRGLAVNYVPLSAGTCTIFDKLSDTHRPWKIYFEQIPFSLALLSLWKYPANFKRFEDFLQDARHDRLPAYSFIEPRYFDVLGTPANDWHPPHDVRDGEQLVAQVYNAVMSGPAADKCLLLVLFDEHGGYYDHVTPPLTTPPDRYTSSTPEFDFTRLGPRVPAILISPYVKPGRDDTVYDHASIPATVKKLFGLAHFLTARDGAANTFENLVDFSRPRIDEVHLPTSAVPAGPATPPLLAGPSGRRAVLSDEQQGLVALARLLESKPDPGSVAPNVLFEGLDPNGPCVKPTTATPAPAPEIARPADAGQPVEPQLDEASASQYVEDAVTKFLK